MASMPKTYVSDDGQGGIIKITLSYRVKKGEQESIHHSVSEGPYSECSNR